MSTQPPPLPSPLAPPAARGLLLAWGDSWTDFSFFEVSDRGKDLRDWLEEFGYRAPATYCKYSVWPKARTLAAHPEAFCEDLDAALLAPTWPSAILLSAGGNDSTKDTLRGLLNPYDPQQPDAPLINEAALARHIADIRGHYETVIGAIRRVFDEHGATTIPIIVHGYDHPLPVGNGAHAREWLKQPFNDLGYDDDAGRNAAAMRHLIEQLNRMFAQLAADHAPDVHHADLQGTIAGLHPANPRDGWEDDLHPTTESFYWLARRVDDTIQQAVGALAAREQPGVQGLG